MACYHPLRGYRTASGSWQSGKPNSTGLEMTVPCGRCVGCRLDRARQWGVRMMHEAQMHDDNSFLTLTYSDENLPPWGNLDKLAVPKFIRRLRKQGLSVRYFYCGEYGDENLRPHYHVCLFGHGFPDRYPSGLSKSGSVLYRSDFLDSMWRHGLCDIGELTFESAAYVARYTTKKLNRGRDEESHRRFKERYERIDVGTGEIFEVEPEFASMSRNPGIGASWFEKFSDDVYPSDEVVTRGKVAKPPRFYDERLRSRDPEAFEQLRKSRRVARRREDETDARLRDREVCTEARISLYS